jgi:mono/diheme cytochrome c family protein
MTTRRTPSFVHWLPVAAAGLLAACQHPTDPVIKGQGYFKTFGCIRCHAVGEAGGHYGPDLTYVGFRKSKEWLTMWLSNPHGWKKNTVMPNLHLPDHVRDALVAYLGDQKGQAFGAVKPWDKPELQKDLVKKGETIFLRAGCTGCHGIRGVGGNPNNNVVGGVIPALTGVEERYSKPEMIDKIRQGSTPGAADPHQPAPMIQMPKWGQMLKASELAALAEFLVTLKAEHKGGKGGGDDF